MATADTVAAEANQAYADAKTLANNALTGVNTALTEAASAVNALPGVGISGAGNPAQVVPTDVIPPILPTEDFSVSVKAAFDYAFDSFNQNLQPQILEYLSAFFPDIAEAVKTSSDQWIIDTIANGRYVPIDVENALWNRARDREINDAARTEQSILDASAARGFSMPPGVTANAIFVHQQETSKKLTTINRDIAVKVFDIANENTKFAITQAVALRTAFVAALGDFIKIAMVQPNNATDYAKTILAAKTGLYDSAVRLYSAQIDEEKMRAGVALENNSHDLRYYDISRMAYNDFNQVKVEQAKLKADTAMSAADQLGAIASAALSTRNTMVSVAAGV